MRVSILLLILLFSVAINAQANIYHALIIANDCNTDLFEESDLKRLQQILEDNEYEVKYLFNRSKDDIEQEFNNFTQKISPGCIVFIYILGYGICDNGNRLLTSASDPQSYWDLDKLMQEVSKKSDNSYPIVIMDVMYQHESIHNKSPIQRFSTGTKEILIMYSGQPGTESNRKNSSLLPMFVKEIEKKGEIRFKDVMDNIKLKMTGDSPWIEGESSIVINKNKSNTVGKHNEKTSPSKKVWYHLTTLVKNEPIASGVVMGGVLGGVGYLVVKMLSSSPEKLPDPPGPPPANN